MEAAPTMEDAQLIKESIAAAMKSEGPIVKAVLLKADGKVEEVDWDSTPIRDHASEILGGTPTIIGEFDSLPVILTQKRDTKPSDPLNQHKLPEPFVNLKIYGDILCIKMDDKAEPRDFTKADYLEYRANPPAPRPEEEEAEGNEEKEGGAVKDSFEDIVTKALAGITLDDLEDEDEEEDDNEERIMEMAVNAFKQATNAEPTEEQLKAVLTQMGYTVEDEPDEKEPVTGLSPGDEKGMLADYFEEFWGRQPSEEEVSRLMQKLPEFRDSIEKDDPEADYDPLFDHLAQLEQSFEADPA